MVAVELTGGIGKQKSKVAEVQCISFFCGFVHGRNLKHEEEISESSWSTHHSNGSDADSRIRGGSAKTAAATADIVLKVRVGPPRCYPWSLQGGLPGFNVF